MPLYEYTCRQCERDFEALVSPGESVACPDCQSERIERHLSVPARPRVAGSLPTTSACNTDLPPCGPGCCRM